MDQTRARHRLDKFPLRHGRVWRDGSNWTHKHHRWIDPQRLDERAATITFDHYRAVLSAREAAVVAIEAHLMDWTTREPFGEVVSRFAAYRGMTALGGLVLASEVSTGTGSPPRGCS